METGLRLLMTDGAIHVSFRPLLTVDQYTELAKVIAVPATKDELCQLVQGMAKRWGCTVEIDDESL